MRFWQKASDQPWAITEPALMTILDIAARTNDTPEEVAKKLGRALNNDYQLNAHEGILEIPIVGPLFRYANLFTMISGATSYERIAADIQEALANDEVGAIILNIDSPGGEVNGCSELAQLIFNARGIKPIIAYASGDCASGAYWIASACDRIVVSDTSSLGSIGVVATVRTSGKDKNVVEVVSSQSPHKRPDYSTDEGRQRLQTRIDELASVFITRVAEHRGVSEKTVLNQYGQGDVEIGKAAVTVGLADELGTFETVMHSIAETLMENDCEPQTSVTSQDNPAPTSMKNSTDDDLNNTNNEENIQSMDKDTLLTEHPELCAHFIHEGKASERERLSEILSCEQAKDRESMAIYFATQTDLDLPQTKAALELVPKTKAIHKEPSTPKQPATPKEKPKEKDGDTPKATTDFEKVMASLGNPNIEAMGEADGEEEEEETEEMVAKRIAEIMN